MGGSSVRLDLRVALPIVVLGLVVLGIIFVELCGREDVSSLVQLPADGQPTATLGPTFTPGPSPTPGPVIPTATPAPQPGGRDRDVIRVQDLMTIQEALQQYLDDNGGYPSTEGSIQTLCVFTEFDAGCELEEVLSPLPEDPLGDASVNGYWYSSDGETYTLYGQREGEVFPVCVEHPDFLAMFDSILCFQGP